MDQSITKITAKKSINWIYLTLIIFGFFLTIGLSWMVSMWGLLVLLAIPLGLIFVGALANPDIGLFGFVFISATQLSNVAIKFYNLPSLAQPLAGVLGLIIVIRIVFYGERPLGWGRAFPILLIYIIGLFFSMARANDFTIASVSFVGVLKDALGGMIVILLIRQSTSLRTAIWAMIIAGLVMGTISVYQYQTKTFDNSYFGFGGWVAQNSGEINRNRLIGPYGNPNAYAQVLVVIVALALDRVWHEKNKIPQLLAALSLVVCGLTVFLTYSRGGLLTLLVTIGFMLFQYRQRLFPIMVTVTLGIALLQFLPVNYIDRINTLLEFSPLQSRQITDLSFRGRISENTAAWRMFLDNPIFGVGLGNYQIQYQDYSRQIGLDRRRTTRTPASFYAEILSEQGLIGAVIFALFVYNIFKSLIIARSQFLNVGLKEQANITMALFAGLLGYLFAATVKNSAYSNFFWVLIGLIFGAFQLSKLSLFSNEEETLSRG